MAGTFISYRREDAAGYAGRLRESLQRRLGSERVFRDVDGLRPGQDFVDAIEASLAACRVMLVVIGREWIENGGHNDANFWDRSFRLAADGEALAPAGDLDDLVPRNSLRYGIVTFPLSPRTTRATLQLFDDAAAAKAPAEIPLDLSPTGRHVVDEQATVTDSLSQAIVRPALSSAASLLDADDLAVSLDRSSTRRFANTLRLRLSIRMANQGNGAIATGSIVMRVEYGGGVAVPLDFPNEVIQAKSTTSATVTFDLPTSTTHTVLRTSAGARSSAVPLELR